MLFLGSFKKFTKILFFLKVNLNTEVSCQIFFLTLLLSFVLVSVSQDLEIRRFLVKDLFINPENLYFHSMLKFKLKSEEILFLNKVNQQK